MADGDLRPFRSDGCSLWPDGNYYGCCVEHDRAYHAGGTRAQRLAADLELRRCVAARGHPILAKIMFRGVRLGGGPWLPNLRPFSRFRWGYGRKTWSWYDAAG